MEIEKEKLIDMYRTMVRIRTFEQRVVKEFEAGRILGFIHMQIGEEAVAVGTCANLRPVDYIVTTHRGDGHLIAKGSRTDRLMAEVFGKKTGCCKGKGGQMHIADMEVGAIGGNGIVGAGIPIAAGAALSAKMRGTDQVAVAFFGDGAINTGRFHEGINLAAVWNLPVVFVITNNTLGEATRIWDVCKLTNLADRACAYGIPGKTVDSSDVLMVYEAVREAVARAKKGDGPTIVECKAHSQHGAFVGDSQVYRTKEEIEEGKKRDPIPVFRDKLIEEGLLTEEQADGILQEALEEMDKAVKFTEDSDFPDSKEVLTEIYT